MSTIILLMTIVSTTLIYAAPLMFAALGGTFSERGGIVNVGLEGIMVVGAFSGAVFNLSFAKVLGPNALWLAILVGGLAGGGFSLLHAVATINFRSDHIISGTVLNMLAPALCIFLTRVLYNQGQTPSLSVSLGTTTVPGLSQLPVLGPVFFTKTSPSGYFAIGVGILCWLLLYRTRFGLRLRSVGENPEAAATLGINVVALRYSGVILSGLLGGMGGAIMAESITLNFSATTIVGQGFMALAVMIFGKWNPLGAIGASLFFGLAQSLAIVGDYIPVLSHLNQVWFQIAPYLITLVVLVLFFGQSTAPAADGSTYIKSK
ncbi:ABC transporter permease [Levilactobacillus bambusae]|uniref:Sugar ABC transporter permease n=1 Tax=Levilactobacillus bambusae TaxID=2024736 RepID=A0A2V1N0Y4_9LACO|nr:ABC transporter permease [Levilactobacillus bambusae]PWG00408.1 sugar ABC transporter permease [Levilactobacillus bambusae]